MKSILLLVCGALLGLLLASLLPEAKGPVATESASAGPLYWVAPMDPNYRRDGPGKSPMGMDLVPVYETETEAPGTVTISPEVELNIGVRTDTARARSLSARITTVGYVGYDEDKLVHLHPRVAGWIEKLYVKAEGDPVKKGQPLYDLYSPELVNAQEDLLLALARGEGRLIEGAKNRLRALKVAEQHIDALVTERKVRQSLTYFAPQAGVVESLAIREGFYVMPGSTLFSIGAIDTVWIDADVYARQVNLLRKGQRVSIRVPHLPGKTFTGELAYIYPTMNADTRTLPVRIRFENPKGFLKPNMFAELDIETDTIAPTLTVPRAAVIRTGTQNRVVQALGAGRFKSVAVQLGRMDDHYIEITEGLAPGDEVVISAQFLLDSESSKSADFLRMSPVGGQSSVWVAAEVKAVNQPAGTLTVQHEAVAQWDWPAMTMDFAMAEGLAMDDLTTGAPVHIEIEKLGQAFRIINIHRPESAQSQSALAPDATADDADIAQAQGVINTLDTEHRQANISRGPVAKWGRGPATVDFSIAASVDINALKPGQRIQFRFRARKGVFTVISATPIADVMPAGGEQ
ncbi:efflux RND transporter periplasmic adaptor subunit [Simiduia sp. 21SJ11W-1]|uniref:efflux RND transporter periplasmic adaptor subunit n=1 Tax=Simiduia sp. 21SJ11W-1 TaxID=2909669 RepID=UPI00209CF955|nr:efflux RND transporter periplasmic adaptor subunit [Simiduia sp. 21SJ11W-1]UTA47116.1 efflux RND transporter periplasmic adaptor subunit [Simiduia sp. 21SJ11W-1]